MSDVGDVAVLALLDAAGACRRALGAVAVWTDWYGEALDVDASCYEVALALAAQADGLVRDFVRQSGSSLPGAPGTDAALPPGLVSVTINPAPPRGPTCPACGAAAVVIRHEPSCPYKRQRLGAPP